MTDSPRRLQRVAAYALVGRLRPGPVSRAFRLGQILSGQKQTAAAHEHFLAAAAQGPAYDCSKADGSIETLVRTPPGQVAWIAVQAADAIRSRLTAAYRIRDMYVIPRADVEAIGAAAVLVDDAEERLLVLRVALERAGRLGGDPRRLAVGLAAGPVADVPRGGHVVLLSRQLVSSCRGACSGSACSRIPQGLP